MKQDIDRGVEIDWAEIEDPNIISSLLKAFFIELTEPLFTPALFDRLVSIVDKSLPEEDAIKEFQDIYSQLEEPVQYLLRHLFDLLSLTASRSDTNKMSPSNLGIHFSFKY